MSNSAYLHSRLNQRPIAAEREGFVITGEPLESSIIEPMQIALQTICLARRLGVNPTQPWNPNLLPYSNDNDNTIFDAPLTSFTVSNRIRFMRGWKQYQSCVKGFNGLGLIAELVITDLALQASWSAEECLAVKRCFALSRRTSVSQGSRPFFEATEIPDDSVLENITALDLAIWRTCANRAIVCSTSSNMGISLHEILRHMQRATVRVGEKELPLLNDNEGQLIIWCPDEEADFMNPEKTAALRSLEAEAPQITRLHTYINRRQRDPGALQDALTLGGYFFPTNPQSREELQNLLANAMRTLAASRGCHEHNLLDDPKVQDLLNTLSCRIEDKHIVVSRGVESGMYGLMAAYLLMLEETLPLPDTLAISTWNQASIGAALAAAVLADKSLRNIEKLPSDIRRALAEILPETARWLTRHQLGQAVVTRIHGVFDIANLQSLAQLLGVTVERHLSGRGIAYVGLGSSSYANGNCCYDILKDSQQHGGPFYGKATFHPATHTVNPIAQALIVAEDLYRLYRHRHPVESNLHELAKEASQHVQKPEPAGSAALAGYLLARLDNGSLSVAELAYTLKLAGFGVAQFLALAGYSSDKKGASWFIQEASEEGEYMQGLANAFLHCLEMGTEELRLLATEERQQSQANYQLNPLDPPGFEALKPIVNIYLTGDNTEQPSQSLYFELVTAIESNKNELSRILHTLPYSHVYNDAHRPATITNAPRSDHNVLGIIRDIFSKNSSRTFLVDTVSKQSLSYSEFYIFAKSIAEVLIAEGLKKTDRLAILMPNGTPLAATYFACMMTGIVAVPVNPELSAAEIGTIIHLSSAKYLMVTGNYSNKIIEAPPVSELPRIQIVSTKYAGYSAAHQIEGGRLVACEKLVPSSGWDPFANISDDDLFLILFTSGTTALPKGVAHTIRSEITNAIAFNSALGLNDECNMLHIWPMAYSSGILNTFLSPFMAEGKITLVAPFDARSSLSFWRQIITEKVNTLWLSPTMIASLIAIDRDAEGIDYCRHNIHTVCCGTAHLPQPVRSSFEEKYGVEVMESYGLTETLILTTQAYRESKKIQSVGTALPGVEIKIAPAKEDDGNENLGGEILARTPYMMQGYLDSQTKQIEFLPAGTYFPTGDLGRLDAEGNLYITGRKKDLIIRGGQTISPASVRATLLALPMIEDAAVTGIHSDFYGEEVGAAIKLRPGYSIQTVIPEILSECRKRLHSGAVPSILIELPEFPRGTTGKILINEIRKEIERIIKDRPNQQ